MQGFVQGVDRQQTTLLPECLDDWVGESNSTRAVDVFVEALDLRDLGFEGVDPAATGRPAYHPSPMLKLYIYGYLNRVQSSRRLEREAGRNVEVMWLTGRITKPSPTSARTMAPQYDRKTVVEIFRFENRGLALSIRREP
jgi:transposase